MNTYETNKRPTATFSVASKSAIFMIMMQIPPLQFSKVAADFRHATQRCGHRGCVGGATMDETSGGYGNRFYINVPFFTRNKLSGFSLNVS